MNDSLRGYLRTQELALRVVKQISKDVRIGDSEKEIAKRVKDSLIELGCKQFFHTPFVWIGDRTVFNDCKHYLDYLPSNRKISSNKEVILIDVAPVIEGYPADIGYSFSIEKTQKLEELKSFLMEIRREIPKIFKEESSANIINDRINDLINKKGYDIIHASKYPLKVLAHKLYPLNQKIPDMIRPFSIQVFFQAIFKGLKKQFINGYVHSEIEGVWAVEPHVGLNNIGAKFEEILIVTKDNVYWLNDRGFYE